MTAIRIINTRIALCANSQRPNARISSASFSIDLMLDPRSGHDFVLPMARLKNRLDTKLEQNKSLDANPETLASLCRVTSRVPATWDSEVILKCGSLRDDGQCQCTVQVVFHLPKGNKLDRDVLESLMTGAAASCSTVIETWLLQRDHFIVETRDELEIEDHVATLRAEQRARAERRINADERRAKARERYLAELDQINRIVASTIDETRAEFVSEARSSLSEQSKVVAVQQGHQGHRRHARRACRTCPDDDRHEGCLTPTRASVATPRPTARVCSGLAN